jgi:hypothetical protein
MPVKEPPTSDRSGRRHILVRVCDDRHVEWLCAVRRVRIVPTRMRGMCIHFGHKRAQSNFRSYRMRLLAAGTPLHVGMGPSSHQRDCAFNTRDLSLESRWITARLPAMSRSVAVT